MAPCACMYVCMYVCVDTVFIIVPPSLQVPQLRVYVCVCGHCVCNSTSIATSTAALATASGHVDPVTATSTIA